MAQLFITPYEQQGNKITLTNPEIIEQCRKVLRLSVGKEIILQNTVGDITTRHTITITDMKQKIIGTISQESQKPKASEKSQMAIAMPNKRDKIELIVQKLSEIGIDQIIFWPSERSIIKERNLKKAERLAKIAKEATEQSRNWFIPEIIFSKTPLLDGEANYIIFDIIDGSQKEFKIQNRNLNICGVIGPEGGLTDKDHDLFKDTKHQIHQLGDGILRTETGAIIGGWLIKNI